MDNLKKLIIIIFIVIVIIMTILIFILIRKSKEGSDYQDTEFEHDISNEKVITEITEVTNRNQYYAVNNIIGKYINAILDGGKESVYYMLDPEYVASQNLTVDNIDKVIDKLIDTSDLDEEQLNNLKVDTTINEMYYKENNINIDLFFVYGKVSNNINKEEVEFKLLIETDSENNTFYIYPSKYIEQQYTDKDSISLFTTSLVEIEKNDYNTFNYINVDDTTIIQEYISKFKNSLIYDLEKSYDLLDEEYKSKKFENIEKYKIYVEKNIKYLLSINITKYRKDVHEDYTEYICIDKNGNYYIIKETGIMKYKLLLDTYTTILPEFIEKYNSVEDNVKVGYNIEKIVQALNLKDYEYIYGKLDDSFKANNFASIEEFEMFVNNMFYSTYDIEYLNIAEEKDIYMQEITLKDKNSEEQIPVTVIMQLKDNYEFVMSFSIQE